jgi:Delta3,5-Delta2,4-dienoyl-CoA isomerase
MDVPSPQVLLTGGEAKHFSAGIDLADHAELFMAGSDGKDVARRAFELRRTIQRYQESFSAIERCPKPVVAAVHGACIGGAVDMICAADIRYASSDAFFCVKEVAIGLAADVGTLQRLPRVVKSDSWVRDICFTARNVSAAEALEQGLVSRVFESPSKLRSQALRTAGTIAEHSPVAVQGTKVNLNFARGRTVADSLEFQSAWNMGMLQTDDIPISAQAAMTKEKARFSKL